MREVPNSLTSPLISFILWLLHHHHPLLVSAEASREAVALLTFKESLKPASAFTSWNGDSFPCSKNKTWYGVVCSHDKGVVTGLRLANMGLSGVINVKSLSELPRLRSISLVNNSFASNLPDFGKLRGLKSLYLSNNKFEGQIHDHLFLPLTHLKKLWLSNNSFSGLIPSSLGTLITLVELHLEGNGFIGTIPPLSFHALKSFNVSNNNLKGCLPEECKRFDRSCFAGNLDLSGPPLVDKPCKALYNATEILDMSNKNVKTLQRKAIALLILISVVLVMVVAIAMTKKRSSETLENVGSNFSINSGDKRVERRTNPMDEKQVDSIKKGSANTDGTVAELVMMSRDIGFTMSDLMKASAEVLGSGGLGSAYKATIANGFSLVVKRMREMNRVGMEQFGSGMIRLGELRHPNVLPPLAFHYRKEEKLLVFEYVERGSLLYLLHGDQGLIRAALDWPTRSKIIVGVARGMLHLHQHLTTIEVPHGNLKSGNVLLNEDFEPLLVDYGYMPFVDPQHAAFFMSSYRTPESIRTGQVSPKSDVYCLGILILEILTGKFPSQYLGNGKSGTDLVQWVNLNLSNGKEDDLFDPLVTVYGSNIDMMKRFLKVGLNLIEPNPELRHNMTEAMKRIEEALEESPLEGLRPTSLGQRSFRQTSLNQHEENNDFEAS